MVVDEVSGYSAFMFPGVGASYPNMLEKFIQANPGLVEKATKLIDVGISHIPQGLHLSDMARQELREQIEIFALSVAFTKASFLQYEPKYLCGHSLGFYAASVAANAVSEEVASQIMVAAFCCTYQEFSTSNECLAVVTTYEPVDQAEVDEAGLETLSLNSQTQLLVYGLESNVEALRQNAAFEILRIDYLPTNLPFHSKKMTSVCDDLINQYGDLPITTPVIPLVSHISGELIKTSEEVRWHIFEQFKRPINWQQTICALKKLGVDTVIEVGPNRILRQISKWIDDSIEFKITDDPKHFSRKSMKNITQSDAMRVAV